MQPRQQSGASYGEESSRASSDGSPHLVWVFSASLADRLDSATWLDTTRELRRLGWQVTLIGIGPAGVQTYRDVEALCIPRQDTYLLGQASFHVNVLRFIMRHWRDIDIILFNQDSGIWLLPLRLMRLLQNSRRPQLVMDTRDISDARPGSLRTTLRNNYVKLNHFLAGQFADGQTTITPRFIDLVHIPRKRLWGIWPSGVNPEPFADAALQRRWPEGDEPIKLVYIGILLEKRHPLQLCRAVRDALEKGRSFELYFYGDGPDAEQVRECAAISGGKIQVVSPIAHQDIPKMLAQMHIGVTSLPAIDDAKYAASSPVKLFEYMASGLPLLTTRNVCHTDVVGDGSFAFWIDEPIEASILESLEQIWIQRASLSELGIAAQMSVDDWTWEAAASRLDMALRSGLERPSVDTR